MRQAILVLVAACVGLSALAVTAAPVAAGPYSRLQVLLPGETAAPGTPSGKTGVPQAQTVGIPFGVVVRACDSQWNLVSTANDAIQVLASDASATLPAPAQLQGGTATFSVVFNAGGNFTLYAHDQSDGTIPDGVSSAVSSLVLATFDFSTIGRYQTAGQPIRVTITARTPGGVVVSGFMGAVRLREFTSLGEGRVSPDTITMSAGTWQGSVTPYRADGSNRSRGNVYLQAELPASPATNGASNPFLVDANWPARVQLVVPGESPLPGSVSGKSGSPANQIAGRSFNATVYSTDDYWNPVGSADQVRVTSSDAAANTPLTGVLSGDSRTFAVTLNTVGNHTLTVADLSDHSRSGMTVGPILVAPAGADHFVISAISSPQRAGVPVAVTIRATDSNGNTIPDYQGDGNLAANTGAGSISPELVSFTNGVWSGSVTFRGAGGAVSFTCSDFSVPPHLGASNSFAVDPGDLAGLQLLLPGETPRGGTADGKEGGPAAQQSGTPFDVTVRAVDAYWNLVPGVAHHVRLGSTDAFAALPADTTLANGQLLIPTRLFRSGTQRIWATDLSDSTLRSDTSSAVSIASGPFARLVVLAPGETSAPGTPGGRAGTATDQSITYAFTVTVLATDAWWNPVAGVSDRIHLTSGDPLAQLPRDTSLVDGRVDVSLRLSTGGYQQIGATDLTRPATPVSATQVRAISSGFHLEAVASPGQIGAGEPFTLTVRVTNDAGSVIQEIHSFVTVEVQNSSRSAPGRGTLLTTEFQLLQGQRSVSETYSFAEPIVLVVRDDAGNAPGVTGVIDVGPGAPAALHLTSTPSWVGGNKHATLAARLVDAYENGIPDRPVVFSLASGAGTLTPLDSLTDSSGVARADYLSPREPGSCQVRVAAAGLVTDLPLTTAFVDPNAGGGTVTNYPNPFHPPAEGTTLAWVLADEARVTLRIFTLSGEPVRRETFERGATGGQGGMNEWIWDGRNGNGTVVASGGYIALIEAQGAGETLHVMRRKIAVVR